MQLAKDKLDAARLEELTDSEEAIAELKRRHEREKLLLLEDNKKLVMDLDTVSVHFIMYIWHRAQKESYMFVTGVIWLGDCIYIIMNIII